MRVEMHNIGVELVTDFQQPATCALHISPGIVHPFQLAVAGEEADVFEFGGLQSLVG